MILAAGNALRSFFELHWLSGLDLGWASAVVVAAYLALGLWALTRADASGLTGAPDRRRWRDLRLWLLPVILIQIALYCWLR